MCVSDSGAFRRQTAAETQTEVASRGFVEVCLGSLTSQLVCYCSGKLCIQGTLCLTEPPANQSSWTHSDRLQASAQRHRVKAVQPGTGTTCNTRGSLLWFP